jgi:predicted enzyme related to lactoylglutathione lyase
VAKEHPTVSLRSIVLDCPDPSSLAFLYAELLGARADTENPEWCEVHIDGSAVKIAFQKVSSYTPPQWPEGSPQQLHLDLTVSDLEQASGRAVALGAHVETGPVDEPGCRFIVHTDPAGHPFCLCSDPTGT